MILHRGSRKAYGRLSQATKLFIEQLESRQLLTTIHGGDVFEFADASGVINRVNAYGPASAQFDLIGATLLPDPTSPTGQSPVLNEVPGRIIRPDGTVIDQLGGIGGADGVELIQVITGAPESNTDLRNPNINNAGSSAFAAPQAVAPSAAINVAQLSSNSKGKTYGFNLIQQTLNQVAVKRLELVNINYTNSNNPALGITPADAVIVQDIAPEVAQLTGATTADIVNVIACDFLPSNDNLLYFGVVVNVMRVNAVNGGMPTAVPIPFLLKYDFSKATPQAAVSLVGAGTPGNVSEFVSDPVNSGAGDVAPTVLGFSFTSNDRLEASVIGRAVGGIGDAVGIGTAQGIVEVDPNNPVFDLNQIVPVTLERHTCRRFPQFSGGRARR